MGRLFVEVTLIDAIFIQVALGLSFGDGGGVLRREGMVVATVGQCDRRYGDWKYSEYSLQRMFMWDRDSRGRFLLIRMRAM